ncbi:enoyl-CoA hydratase/isomerase family protein [Streptomyces sp. NPDC020792]|uniref:enoyl-CoA hydratase/isomerase family protein n=1 Tax=Streptomyces sp. NPDC020792 TaxID=3365089 RepID=UPI0037A935BF
MDSQTRRTVLFDADDRIARITLNRCGALNAVDAEMGAELRSAWSRGAADPGLVGVILIGAGGEAFSLGIDRSPGTMPAPADSLLSPRLDVPLVVAVNGMACAEALELIRAADTVVAAEHARFFPVWPLSSSSGGAPVHAAEAVATGLVDTVVPLVWLRDEAEKAVRWLAGKDNAPARAKGAVPGDDGVWRSTRAAARRPPAG